MAPFLKQIPVLTLFALSACLAVSACGHDADQRASRGGGVYVGGAIGR